METGADKQAQQECPNERCISGDFGSGLVLRRQINGGAVLTGVDSTGRYVELALDCSAVMELRAGLGQLLGRAQDLPDHEFSEYVELLERVEEMVRHTYAGQGYKPDNPELDGALARVDLLRRRQWL